MKNEEGDPFGIALNAADRNRTCTSCGHKNLNLARLPIPPQPRELPGHLKCARIRVKVGATHASPSLPKRDSHPQTEDGACPAPTFTQRPRASSRLNAVSPTPLRWLR